MDHDQSMERIWDEWYRPLAAFLRTSFGLRGDIDDLMQEIMLKVHCNLERYDPRWAMSTWLYTIARNTCLDWLKRPQSTAASLTNEPCDRISVESQVMGQEIERLVAAVLAGLEPIDRGIAWLAFYERAPYRWIARVFELPPSTIKMRIHRIRGLLKRKLEDYHA